MYLSSETCAYSMSNLGMQAITIWVTSIMDSNIVYINKYENVTKFNIQIR